MLNTITGMLSGGVAATDYESIATTTVGSGGSATITFSSIPSTYTHLQIRGIGRSAFAAVGAQFATMQFNGDTASNYAYHNLQGDGSTASATATTTTTNLYILWCPQLEGAGAFGVGVIDILDYKDTNKYKTVRTLYGAETNATLNRVGIRSGLWQSTSAISSITFNLTGGYNFEQYSQFALYGIK